ncbi:MAG: hypothetical protein JNK85_03140 [Verrucomicrobiales bacterium]|nr:hypothetical protein [Verrucomicrobiales bacterium]
MTAASVVFGLASSARLQAETLIVPGSADPWLAGMPDGSTASWEDTAPGQSPVLYLINSPQIVGLSFSATGSTHHGPGILRDADGDPSMEVVSHSAGAENGISDVTSPISSLLGVFLDDTQPDQSSAPSALSFSTAESPDYLVLSPGLKQVFFIGDGFNSASQLQVVEVPPGATRLFLGTMDGYGWWNNVGELVVEVLPIVTDPVPVPEGTTVLSGLALGTLIAAGIWRRRQAQS